MFFSSLGGIPHCTFPIGFNSATLLFVTIAGGSVFTIINENSNINFFFFLAVLCFVAGRILVSLTGDWTWASAVKVPSSNHWTARELPKNFYRGKIYNQMYSLKYFKVPSSVVLSTFTLLLTTSAIHPCNGILMTWEHHWLLHIHFVTDQYSFLLVLTDFYWSWSCLGWLLVLKRLSTPRRYALFSWGLWSTTSRQPGPQGLLQCLGQAPETKNPNQFKCLVRIHTDKKPIFNYEPWI